MGLHRSLHCVFAGESANWLEGGKSAGPFTAVGPIAASTNALNGSLLIFGSRLTFDERGASG
jgi:hypothetical protein